MKSQTDLIANSLKEILKKRLPKEAVLERPLFDPNTGVWTVKVDFPNAFTEFQVEFRSGGLSGNAKVSLTRIRVPSVVDEVGDVNWIYLVALGKLVEDLEGLEKEATKIFLKELD